MSAVSKSLKDIMEEEFAYFEMKSALSAESKYKNSYKKIFVTSIDHPVFDVEKLREGFSLIGLKDFGISYSNMTRNIEGAPIHVLHELTMKWNETPSINNYIIDTVTNAKLHNMGFCQGNVNWISTIDRQGRPLSAADISRN